jgi:uncharacterized membrane protein YkoI
MNRKTATAVALASLVTAGMTAAPALAARDESDVPGYSASIKVTPGRDERAETEGYAELAKISLRQAVDAAEAKIRGKAIAGALENEGGNLVYRILVQPPSPAALQRVIVDAGTAAILDVKARHDGHGDGEGDEEDDD